MSSLVTYLSFKSVPRDFIYYDTTEAVSKRSQGAKIFFLCRNRSSLMSNESSTHRVMSDFAKKESRHFMNRISLSLFLHPSIPVIRPFPSSHFPQCLMFNLNLQCRTESTRVCPTCQQAKFHSTPTWTPVVLPPVPVARHGKETSLLFAKEV